MSITTSLVRTTLLFGLGMAIVIPKTFAQSTGGKPVIVESCHVHLLDDRELACGVPGVLEYVGPEEGDMVQAEEIIVRLEADVMKAQKAIALKEAQNDVEKRYAQKAAELADAEHRKALEANRILKGTVAAVEVDRLRLAAERAHLQIEQAEHQLDVATLKADEAEANFQIYNIKAPISGVVTRKYKSRGEAVRQGDTILVIQNTERVKVEGYVKLQDMFRVKRGDKVKVRLNIPGVNLPEELREMDGVLKLVDPSVEAVGQKVRVWAEVQNPNGVLRAGLNTEMTILPEASGDLQTLLR